MASAGSSPWLRQGAKIATTLNTYMSISYLKNTYVGTFFTHTTIILKREMMDKSQMKQDYIDHAIIHQQASCNGDYLLANKAYRKIENLRKQFSTNNEFAKELLSELLQMDNPSVQVWASAHSLELGINIEMAKAVLERISRLPNIGIISFTAEMTLKQWQKGELSTHKLK
jgi:hypothetical protein